MKPSHTLLDRFLRYVQIDTESDPHATSFPSTEKQKDLAKMLVDELQEIGLSDAVMDAWGYVFATIPSNISKNVPVVCFCAHMDTAPDCSGKNVKPIVHSHYQGQDIILPDDPSQVLRISDHPYLASCIGHDIVTASGTTLLGADDKAGVAIIMSLAAYLMQHPEIPHGAIRILFTPDEEVGRGVEKLDMQRLAADFGYTLDGGERGSLEDESFSADGVTITIHGVSAHPGAGKGKLVNALKVASDFIAHLPIDTLTPESTEGREGFIHPIHMEGIPEKVTLQFLIRDFETSRLQEYEDRIRVWLDACIARHPGARADMIVKEQYRNMKEVLAQYPKVAALAATSMQDLGLEVHTIGIRGGTDGSRLSFMGLPCPNIFTGEMALHSKLEYVSVQDMEMSLQVLVKLVQYWSQEEK